MAAIIGAAQGPSVKWQPNPDGPRTIEQAVEIARRHGVEIPEDVEFVLDDSSLLDKGMHARYFAWDLYADQLISWSDFYHSGNYVPVLLRDSVLESDEGIVAVFTHELFELSRLREMFEESEDGKLSSLLLDELVRPGVRRNLHCEAWDRADEAVRQMRENLQ